MTTKYLPVLGYFFNCRIIILANIATLWWVNHDFSKNVNVIKTSACQHHSLRELMAHRTPSRCTNTLTPVHVSSLTAQHSATDLEFTSTSFEVFSNAKRCWNISLPLPKGSSSIMSMYAIFVFIYTLPSFHLSIHSFIWLCRVFVAASLDMFISNIAGYCSTWTL